MPRLAHALLALLLAAPASAQSPAAVLAGRVVDEASAGLPGVKVSVVDLPWDWEPLLATGSATPKEPAALAHAVTDERGMFVLDAAAIPRGFHALRIEAPGRVALVRPSERIAFGQGPLPRDLVIPLLPPVSLAGIVLDDRGAAVPQAAVSLTCESPSGSAAIVTKTGPDGRLKVDGLPALATVAVRAVRGDASDVVELTLPLAGRAAFALHLQPSRVLSGSVVSADGGAAIAGARIVVLGATAPRASRMPPFVPGLNAGGDFVASEHASAADGSFQVSVPAGARAVLLQPGFDIVTLRGGRNVVRAQQGMSGTVVEGRETPVPGATIRLGRTAITARTDARGAFQVPSDGTEMVVLSPSGSFARLQVRGGSSRVTLPSQQRLTGRIVAAPATPEAEPAPVPHATLRFVVAERWQALTAAAADGSFSIVLPQPPSSLRATSPTHGGWIALDATGPEHSVTGVLDRAAPPMRVRVRAGGAPVPGALLVAREAQASGHAFIARADAEGIAEVWSQPPASVRVRTHAPGAQPDDVVLASTSSGAQDVVLPPASSLVVACLDEAGQPLEGCAIEASAASFGREGATRPQRGPFGGGARATVQAASDAAGLATIEGLAIGECASLVARRPGRSPVEVECARGTAGAPSRIEMRLARGASLAGIVRDPEGNPVALAEVIARGDSSTVRATDPARRFMEQFVPGRTALSGADGAYELRDLESGRVEILARAQGFLESEAIPVDLAIAEQGTLDVSLRAGASLEGIVVFADGKPAAGASVEIGEQLLRPMGGGGRGGRGRGAMGRVDIVVAGSDGRFAMRGLDPSKEYSLTPKLDGEEGAHRTARPGGEPLTLTIVARGRIAGRVTGADAIAEAIRVRCLGAPEGDGSAGVDAEGAFEVTGLDAGTYACTAIAGDEADGASSGIVVTEGQTSTTTIKLGPRARQDVVVLSTSGAPVAGATVQSSGGGRTERTGPDGRASVVLPPAPPGMPLAIEISANAEGFASASLPLPQPRPAVLELRLRPSVVVRGSVTDPDGRPAVGVRVGANSPGGAVTGADGSFEFSLGRPGTYELRAERNVDGATESASLSVQVPESGLDGVALRLERTASGSLLVLVTDAGAPATGANLYVQHDSQPDRGEVIDVRMAQFNPSGVGVTGQADSEGTLLAEGLRPGEYRIYAGRASETTLRRAGRARVDASSRADATIEIPGGAMVRGSVTLSGTPIEGAGVSAHRVGAGDGWMRGIAGAGVTGAGGRFELGPFPEGVEIEVRAIPPDGLRAARTASATVLPGAPAVTIDLAGVSITGRVLAAGEPVAGARVQARKAGTVARAEVRSSPDGSFAIDGLDPLVEYDLSASLPGKAPAAMTVTTPAMGSLAAGVLEIGGSGELAGTATRTDGGPVDQFRLALLRGDGTRLPVSEVNVAADGTWSVAARAEEPLSFRASTFQSCGVLGVTRPGEPLELAFPSGAGLTLEVVASDGRPVSGATARLVSWEGRPADEHLIPSRLAHPRMSGGTSDARGLLSIERLMPGANTILVERGGSSASVTVTVAEGESAEARVHLP